MIFDRRKKEICRYIFGRVSLQILQYAVVRSFFFPGGCRLFASSAMKSIRSALGLLLALPALSTATTWHTPASVPPRSSGSNDKIFKREQNGVTYNVFEHRDTNSTLSFVQDSGICETTPGVTTYSGYLSVGTNMSMWFWFFEARSNASTAPLALWLNGGPGCSSMIGLFQENGPCRFVNGSDEPSLNPYSWNNYAVC